MLTLLLFFIPPLASPTPVPIPSEDYVDKILDEFETEKKTTDDFHEEFYENHDIGSLESEEKDYPILALPNNHGTELIDELLGGTYDWRVRPTGTNLSLPGSHGPVIVNVNMLIRSISKIDEINMEYSVQMTFREEWMDHRLSFGSPGDNKPEFLILTAGQQIWMPDSFFQNEKIANRHSLDKPNVMIRIHKDGRILYSVRISMVLSCPMHLENYPMDVQECVIDLASYAYTENEIDYQWKDNDPVQLKKGLHSSLPNFQLQNSTTTYCTSKTTTGTYSCLRVVLEFRRQFSYYLFQLYAPTTMLVTVSWFSFWLDKGDIAARVTLGITTLLTMAAQASGINAKLPPVSYTKAIDIWIGACLTFIFAAFLEFAWVTYTNTWGRNKKFSFKKISTHGHNLKTHLIHKPKATVWLDTENSEENIRFLTIPLERSASYELKNIFFVKWMSKVLENQDAAKKADIMSRILFPLAFIMFNLVYWVTYSEK